MAKWLITGANGNLGRRLIASLTEADEVVADLRDAGFPSLADGRDLDSDSSASGMTPVLLRGEGGPSVALDEVAAAAAGLMSREGEDVVI